jgi:hypothetical protein
MSKEITVGVATLGLVIMLAFAGVDQVSGDAGSQDQAGEGARLYGIDAPEVAQAQDCSIKGNISKSGERLPEHVWLDLAGAAEVFARQALQRVQQ